jgi:4-hydroxy-tetrahydrodipicolinate synthase
MKFAALLGILLAAGPAAVAGDPPAFFRGIIVPMVTPYAGDAAERVDQRALTDLTRYLCRSRAAALFPVSGTGQWKRLSMDEKKTVITTVVRAARKKKPVIAGVGSPNGLEETLELARFAEGAGAAAIAVVTPSYVRDAAPEIGGRRRILDQDALAAYYTAVASTVACPVMIYDAEGEMEPATLQRLVDACPNINAIKVRPRKDPTLFPAMVEAAHGKAAVLSGSETVALHPLQQGAVGIIGNGLNVYPDLAAGLMDAIAANQWARAEEIQRMLIEANARLERLGGGAQGVKKILNDVAGVRMSPVNRGDTFRPESYPGEYDEIVRYFRGLGLRPR